MQFLYNKIFSFFRKKNFSWLRKFVIIFFKSNFEKILISCLPEPWRRYILNLMMVEKEEERKKLSDSEKL